MEGKYLFSNFRFFVHSLNQYALCSQITFFSFLFTQYPKQMLTQLTMLKCTTSWRKRIQKKKKKLNDACFFSVKCGTIGLTFIAENWKLGDIGVKCVILQQSIITLWPCSYLSKLWSWTHKVQSRICAKNRSTSFVLGCIQAAKNSCTCILVSPICFVSLYSTYLTIDILNTTIWQLFSFC